MGGSKIKLVTVDVSSNDFPELFKYIDSRNKSYTLATEDKIIVSVSYEIVVGNNTYNASSIAFRDYSGSDNRIYVNAPSAKTITKAFNGLKVIMSSTVADGDLHFNKLSYTYIQL